jgi:TrmH family RNA methyltransferase
MESTGRNPPLLARIRLVLVRTAGPINLGMIARTCGNWGIDDCWLVDPQCSIDCDDTRKFANRAIDWLRERSVVDTIDQALADCGAAIATTARPRDGVAPLSPTQVPHWLQAMSLTTEAPIALVFGNEQHGLNESEYAACQAGLRLPMPGTYQSFNLAQAVATALGMLHATETAMLHATETDMLHATENGTTTPPPSLPEDPEPPAQHAQRRELVDCWDRAADHIQHLTGVEAGKRDGWLRKMDHWLMHTPMRREEANAMRAFLATLLKHR